MADATLAEVDLGAGNATIEFRTAGDVEVATLTCSDPAGSVTGPTLTFSAITPDAAATGGLATKFAIINPGASDTVLGSVGTTGTDIIMSSNNITPGSAVSISTLTYTAPP